jgi:hypothetical protein
LIVSGKVWLWAVIQRVDLAPAVVVADGGGDELLGLGDGVLKAEAVGEAGGDGGGCGAACAVGGDAVDALGMELGDFSVWLEEEVGGVVAGEMAAFEEPCGAVGFGEGCAGGAHVLEGADGAAGEDGDFIHVWRDDGGAEEEAFFVEIDGLWEQEACAAGGDHDGIDDEGHGCVFEEIADFFDDFGGVEHPGFHSGDGEGGEGEADLLGDDRGGDWVDGADFSRDLGDDAGDGGQAVCAEGGEGLEIGLCAGAGAVIGAGDGEGYGWCVFGHERKIADETQF